MSNETEKMTPDLRAFIEEWKDKPGNLIMVLHKVQQTYGYLIKEFERQLGVGVNTTTSDGLFSIEAVRCLGCCGLAPVAVVNGDVHGKLETKDVAGIIEKYRTLG